MYVFMNALYLIAGWIWVDWRHWKEYYPTVLFLIIGDFLYNFLLYNESMWTFHDLILPNHTLITVFTMAISYSVTVFIYLGRFPQGWKKRSLWFLLWSGLYIAIEYINNKLGFITYDNGWNIWWSALITAIIFLILPIHHKRPIVAWVIAILIIVALLNIFDVKISEMK